VDKFVKDNASMELLMLQWNFSRRLQAYQLHYGSLTINELKQLVIAIQMKMGKCGEKHDKNYL
jgi:hypothetical protein